jgi:tripartite-type tricarboxylate transporter receptor subunit TctC
MKQSRPISRLRRQLVASAPLAAFLASAGSTYAQAGFPSRTIRLIVPWAPGGLVDTGARVLAEGFAPALGQAAVVENIPGAAGTLGAAHVAKAPADGHTLLLGTSSIAIDIAGRRKMNLDPLRELTPVAMISDSFSVIVVQASSPWQSLGDLLRAARAEPGKLSYGTPGIGSPAHLFSELLAQTAGLSMLHVPYGRSPAINDLMGGQLSLMVATVPVAIPHIRSGRLRALAVTGTRRLSNLPEVPTAAEAGVAGYEASQWLGLFAPAGTPETAIARLAAEVRRITAQPGNAKLLESRGLDPREGGPSELAQALRTDIGKWQRVMDQAGIRLDA